MEQTILNSHLPNRTSMYEILKLQVSITPHFSIFQKLDNFTFVHFFPILKWSSFLWFKVKVGNCWGNWSTTDQLADYLTYLDGNDTAYAEYFEWKQYFKSKTNLGRVFCQICMALHNVSYPVSTHKVPVEPIKFYCDSSRKPISFSLKITYICDTI